MDLNSIDILIFIGFFVVVVGVSLYKSRGEENSEDYFLAGRGLTWPLIGISIVAANLSTEQFVGMAGQAAGSAGIAVSLWQLTGSVGVVIIAFTLLPRFLRAGIYTMPEYLEYRYNGAARAIMAIFTTIIYVVVTITAVLYSGGLTMHTIFGMDLTTAVWFVGGIAALYTIWGGLKAIAWADLFQGSGLILGGLLTMVLGFYAVGGMDSFLDHNSEKLHLILSADHELLPWTGVVGGMWIPILYYCGLNQFIVQRTLAAKSLSEGQLGLIFAAAIWLAVPFVIVFPGMMADQLYGAELANPDQAYPTLIQRLIPLGARGLIFAALAGAVVSSLASMLNSASTVFTMDLYNRYLHRDSSQSHLVKLGRIMTLVFVVIGCILAPELANPKFKGVFNFIQEFQGYISPGIVAVFVMGFFLKRAPGMAGVIGLLVSAPIYGFQHWQFGDVHFLLRMLYTFVSVSAVMGVLTLAFPLSEPRVMPVREDIDLRTNPVAKVCAALVLIAVTIITFLFW